MKYIASTFFVLSVAFANIAYAKDSESIATAEAAANSWLSLTDEGEYSKSWDQASSIFKAAVSDVEWQKAIQATRTSLGRLKSRTLKSATLTHSLPGVPDGYYVVLSYESHFEYKNQAIETVTPMLEKDGKWKVTGYFVK